jgi:hypothetical protein
MIKIIIANFSDMNYVEIFLFIKRNYNYLKITFKNILIELNKNETFMKF